MSLAVADTNGDGHADLLAGDSANILEPNSWQILGFTGPLVLETTGVRADDHPRRYESIELVYRISGPTEDDQPKIDRAIELSRDKYCSVLQTMDPAIDLTIRSERV